MSCRPTTLEKLHATTQALEQQVAQLRLEHLRLQTRIRVARWRARKTTLAQIGQLVEDCGLDTRDLAGLQQRLQFAARAWPLDHAQPLCSAVAGCCASGPGHPAELPPAPAPDTRQDEAAVQAAAAGGTGDAARDAQQAMSNTPSNAKCDEKATP